MAARKPSEQKPKAPPPRPPTRKTAPSRQIEPGDLVCGQCGEPNKPERKFCRRCANSLADASVAKVSLFKRIFRRRRKAPKAGERPGRPGSSVKSARRRVEKTGRGVMRLLRAVVALAVILAAVGVIGPWREPVVGWVTDQYERVRRIVAPNYEMVNPSGVTASSELPDHQASATIDGFDNTWWTEGSPGDGTGETLTITFAEPTDLARIGFLAGAPGEAAPAHGRPRELVITWDGGGAELELSNTAEFQDFAVDAAQITQLQIRIDSVWPAVDSTDMAITLIRFFIKT